MCARSSNTGITGNENGHFTVSDGTFASDSLSSAEASSFSPAPARFILPQPLFRFRLIPQPTGKTNGDLCGEESVRLTNTNERDSDRSG